MVSAPAREDRTACKRDGSACVVRMVGRQSFLRSFGFFNYRYSAGYSHKKKLLEQFLYPSFSSDCSSLSRNSDYFEACAELHVGLHTSVRVLSGKLCLSVPAFWIGLWSSLVACG